MSYLTDKRSADFPPSPPRGEGTGGGASLRDTQELDAVTLEDTVTQLRVTLINLNRRLARTAASRRANILRARRARIQARNWDEIVNIALDLDYRLDLANIKIADLEMQLRQHLSGVKYAAALQRIADLERELAAAARHVAE